MHPTSPAISDAGPISPLTAEDNDVAGWPNGVRNPLSALAGPTTAIMLAILAVLLVAIGGDSSFRAVVVAAALAVVPGAAVLPRAGTMDGWVSACSAVMLSITIEVLVSLVMIWSSFWHPRGAGCALLLLGASIIAARTARSQFDWNLGHWLGHPQGRRTADPVSRAQDGSRTSDHLALPLKTVPTWWDFGALSAPASADLSTGSTSMDSVGAEHDVTRSGTQWNLLFDDGRRVELSAALVVGRRPLRREARGEPRADVLVADHTRTVSRRHLRLEPSRGDVSVIDLGSLNGTAVTAADGRVTTCEDGKAVTLSSGDVVSFGDHWLLIEAP